MSIEITVRQLRLLKALKAGDSARGATLAEAVENGTTTTAPAGHDERIMTYMVQHHLVEQRGQLSDTWPSGRVAERVPLQPGQTREALMFRIRDEGMTLLAPPASRREQD